MKVYILGDNTYAAMMERFTPHECLILEMMRANGEIIVSPYLPEGERGYIYDGPSLTDAYYQLPNLHWFSC